MVASLSHVRWIAEARVKTDAADVLHLARLLAANLVPEVWVPRVHVRELRSLIAYRRRVVAMQTMTKNRPSEHPPRQSSDPAPRPGLCREEPGLVAGA